MDSDTPLTEVDLTIEQPTPLAWMCRPCEWYKDEYKECKKILSRLHQYFIFGKSIDCSQWNTDYQNCMDYRSKKSVDSLQRVIDSEMKRVRIRKQAQDANDVWEARTSPPTEMWNLPLPKWLTSYHKGSLLEYYANSQSQTTS